MNTAQEEALAVIQALKQVLPVGSPLVGRVRNGYERLTTEIDTLKWAGTLTALDGTENAFPGVILTGKERAILAALMKAGNRGMSKDGLLANAYSGIPDNSWPEQKIIDVFVCKLRKKFFLAKLPNPIQTVYGAGYRICKHEPGTDYALTYPHIWSDAPAQRQRSPRKSDFELAIARRKAA